MPSDNNSPNRTDYPRETKAGEKKGKVLPSDNNSPFRLLHKFQSKFQLRKIILISQHYTDKACSRVLIGLTANRETAKKKSSHHVSRIHSFFCGKKKLKEIKYYVSRNGPLFRVNFSIKHQTKVRSKW